MTYKKINNFAPHEDNGFDIFLGMSGWIFGLFEGIVARLQRPKRKMRQNSVIIYKFYNYV
jgi:hypothetical protein